MTRYPLLAGALLLATSISAFADSSIGNNGSQTIGMGAISILAAPVLSVGAASQGRGESALGPVLAVTGSAYVIVGIVQGAGDVAELTLESVQGGAKLLVKAAGSAVKASGAAVGASVQVTATASGTLLVTSGKVLAFIPNKLGEALLEHSRVPE
ncbi:hypothetical protein DK842_09030 [Chromobacterium phragmitis]|uniref:Uncharacterized protein n=1 Tax=Chromobacterium phragmitis TaxID=2202141 RepID=A0A344UJG8_9NEIS|nr:hypothetical protein [Chromobacterium phragmitis]AXE30025.1 hypothetical protein DK842_09030 [Chromobacterium phragmitis]AXE35416.1 hypothetical protein DK843_14585 [Chromobacterium phragmitis]